MVGQDLPWLLRSIVFLGLVRYYGWFFHASLPSHILWIDWLDRVCVSSGWWVWEEFLKSHNLLGFGSCFDFTREEWNFTIYYDSSRVELFCVLMYKHKMIIYDYKDLKTRDRNYPTQDLGLAIVVFVLKLWWHHLYGNHCDVLTYHWNLPYIFSKKIWFAHVDWTTKWL